MTEADVNQAFEHFKSHFGDHSALSEQIGKRKINDPTDNPSSWALIELYKNACRSISKNFFHFFFNSKHPYNFIILLFFRFYFSF